MFRLTAKGLWAHKLRFALTGLAVVLGVSFMAGTMVLTDTMSRTFDGIFETANEGVDVVVQRPAAIDGEFVDARERVPATVLDEVRQVEGVAAAAGSIQGFAQVVFADGETGSLDGLGATIGMNWVDGPLSPFDLDQGRPPVGAGEVVLDKSTVEREGWQLGATVTVLGKTEPRAMTLVGTARYGAIDGLPGSTLVAVDDPTAQEMFGEPGAYDTVMVMGEDGTANGELADRIDTALEGTGVEVLTGEQDTADKQAEMKDDLKFFNSFLLAFAYVSLFVGMFIIHNTFSIVLAQRAKDLAVLRAIGAGRRQVLASVVGEAAAIGLVSAAVGLGLGVLMSFGLRELLATVGLDIPGGDVVISQATVVTSLAVGLVVTLVSAVAPALRASKVAPIAALRETAIEQVTTSVRRVVAGVVLTGAGAAVFTAGTRGEGKEALQLLGVGALFTIVGLLVLGPAVVRPIMRVLGLPAKALSGATGDLARENARRNPKRTAATAAALAIGVALVGFITILAVSTKASVADAVDRSFRADFVVDSGVWGEGGFSPVLAGEIDALPEVDSVTPLRSAPIAVDGQNTTVVAVDAADISRFVDLDVTDGAMPDLGTDGIAIQRDKADDQGLQVGDPVTVTFARTGPVELVVGAIFEETVPGIDGDWIIDVAAFEANVTDQFDRQVYVELDDSVSAADGAAAIDGLLTRWPNAELEDQASFKEGITSEIDQMLNLIYGLLALAVIIALIGIANTLALSVHERTRELGLLRAVGMTRHQLRVAIRWESVMIALLGTIVGTALALLGAWGIVQSLRGEGLVGLTIPVTRLLVIVVLAAMAGILAATGPARRAARLDVLKAIAAS